MTIRYALALVAGILMFAASGAISVTILWAIPRAEFGEIVIIGAVLGAFMGALFAQDYLRAE